MVKSFASDNNASVHPKVLQLLNQINTGHVSAYGYDPITQQAEELIKSHFGGGEVFFVYNGTAANVLSVRACCDSFHAVVCASESHLHIDECGAAERLTGCKLLLAQHQNGKINIESIQAVRAPLRYDEHQVLPKLISITQSTELGTVYTPDEITAIAEFAKAQKMYLHIDGARLANAAAALGCSMKSLTVDLGVDILSLGGTKNGLMGAEAVICFQPELAFKMKYYRKQNMQLNSKMRYLSAQMLAYFTDNLWLKNAQAANHKAQTIAQAIKNSPHLRFAYPPQANALFVQLSRKHIEALQSQFYFYVWEEDQNIVRWMCAFDTPQEWIDELITAVQNLK